MKEEDKLPFVNQQCYVHRYHCDLFDTHSDIHADTYNNTSKNVLRLVEIILKKEQRGKEEDSMGRNFEILIISK